MPPAKTGRNPRISKGAEIPQCHIHDEVDDYQAKDIRQNVCVNDLPLTEYAYGKYYCLFHLPTENKDSGKFEEIFRTRLAFVRERVNEIEKLPEDERERAKDELYYDFRCVWFPVRVDLSKYKFEVGADFSSATFSQQTEFRAATFVQFSNFWSATFLRDADFSSAIFREGVYFSAATFSQIVSFNWAKMLEKSRVFFQQTRFAGQVNFQHAFLAGYIAFEGNTEEDVFLDKAILDLQNARIEKPERISFQRVRLRPSWFVNTDSRKMVFTEIRWSNLKKERFNKNIVAEIGNLMARRVSEPRGLLEIACRQLGVNAEENNRYEEASQFRYMAMETKRLEYAWQGRLWTLNWWYRFSSGYGENWKRAGLLLLGVLLFFGLLYWSPLSTFDYGEQKDDKVLLDVIEKESDWTRKYDERFHRMGLGEGLVHSLYVAALQRPEPKAADTLTRFFIILETIFAPLQAALLALAIRRKFMR